METTLQNKITQSISLIDEAFDVKQTQQFQLIVQLSLNSILITVNEKTKNKYIAFENYTLHNTYNFDAVADAFEWVFKESKITNHKYKSVKCVMVNNLSTLVPDALYEDDRKKMFLKFNTSLQGDELVLTDDLKNLEAKNIFALHISIKTKLDYHFLNVAYHHYSSGMIDSLIVQNKNKTGKKFFVHVQQSHFEAIVLDGKNLLFYNTFNHHSAEDFIYYVLFVCEQLQLNPETQEVILLGEIERNSTIFALTQKYIRNIKFGERNDGAQYSYQLQALPKGYYFTLFNNYYL